MKNINILIICILLSLFDCSSPQKKHGERSKLYFRLKHINTALCNKNFEDRIDLKLDSFLYFMPQISLNDTPYFSTLQDILEQKYAKSDSLHIWGLYWHKERKSFRLFQDYPDLKGTIGMDILYIDSCFLMAHTEKMNSYLIYHFTDSLTLVFASYIYYAGNTDKFKRDEIESIYFLDNRLMPYLSIRRDIEGTMPSRGDEWIAYWIDYSPNNKKYHALLARKMVFSNNQNLQDISFESLTYSHLQKIHQLYLKENYQLGDTMTYGDKTDFFYDYPFWLEFSKPLPIEDNSYRFH